MNRIMNNNSEHIQIVYSNLCSECCSEVCSELCYSIVPCIVYYSLLQYIISCYIILYYIVLSSGKDTVYYIACSAQYIVYGM